MNSTKNGFRTLLLALAMLLLPAVGHTKTVSVEAGFTVSVEAGFDVYAWDNPDPFLRLATKLSFHFDPVLITSSESLDVEGELEGLEFDDPSCGGNCDIPLPSPPTCGLIMDDGESGVNADVLGFRCGDPGWDPVPFGDAAQFNDALANGTVAVPFFSYYAQDTDGTAINVGDSLVDVLNNMTSEFVFPLGGALYVDLTVDGITERARYFLELESVTANVSTVPVPAAAWLFASGLLGLVGVARRSR